MLTYSLSDTGTDSLYLYLYKCIKKDILNGVLPSGTKLPSKRSFAKNLGVSNITVENSYALLQSEGYIFSLPKRGFFVSDLPLPAARGTLLAPPPLQTEKPSTLPPVFADFVNNHTIPESFPFSIWAKLLRETISLKSNELMTNPPCGGIFELRDAICAHLKQFRGMEIRPEQVIIGAGTDYLYSMLILLLGRDKTYAVENPGYTKIEKVYRTNGVACRFVNMDAFGIKIEELNRQDADIAHISPSHHYPTGIVTPVSRRYELLGWAAARPNRYIIEDDYDSEFRFAARPMPTLQSIDAMEKVIYMNTFTKSLASTIRISYMVLPPHLLRRFLEELSFYSGTVSNFEQYTLAKFIRDGYFEKHINRMRNYYRTVRDALLAEIENSALAACCTIAEESAGLHFILRIHTPLTEQELIRSARMHGLHLSCLSEYYHADAGADAGQGASFAEGTAGLADTAASPTNETATPAGTAGSPAKKTAAGTDTGTSPARQDARAVFTHALVMNYSGIRKEDIKEAVRRLSESILTARN